MDLAKSLEEIRNTEIKEKPKAPRGDGTLNIIEKIETIKLIDKVLFSRYLALMIRSGVSLSRGLGMLEKQFSQKKFQKVIAKVKSDVSGGTELSKAMKQFPRVFSPIYINMVASGEASGKLDEILEQLAIQLKKDYTLVKKVKGAMIYPSIVIVAMAIMMVVMFIFVIPKMTKLFKDLDLDLPIVTKIIIDISNLLKDNTLIFLVIVGAIAGGFAYIKNKPYFQKISHPILLRTPIFGKISQKMNLARFSRILSSLMSSGLPIVKSLNISAKAMSNIKYTEAIEEAAIDVQKGIDLKTSLSKHPRLFPGMITQLTEVGQETGSMDEILEKIAEFYETEVDQTVKNLSTVIEPLLMIVIGLGVAVIAAAVLLPIYSIVDKLE